MTKEQLIKLRWFLLECKYVYYHAPAKIKGISDQLYDELEDLYKTESGDDFSVVGFKLDSPSGKLIQEKINSKKTLSFELISDIISKYNI